LLDLLIFGQQIHKEIPNFQIQEGNNFNRDREMSSDENIWNSIEKKWLDYWDKNHTNRSDPQPNIKKFFITVAYPYPNSPQHIGHGRTYTIADVHARYKRLKGYNVLFPMGFHYTGTPILGMSKRVQAGDTEIIENFKTIYKVDKKDIDSFVDPLKIAKYFHNEIRLGMKEMGYSIDWRREFTTIDPVYKKLISWQFETLKKLGVIEQGSHPVGWCPNDSNPVSQHDTLGDVEPAFTEYTLIKLRLEGVESGNLFLPVATLRPETLFGVTNLWINPNEKYLIVSIDGKENWLVSKEATNKLTHMNYDVNIVKEVNGSEFIGLTVTVPITKKSVPILPASFVTLDEGSGVVMSVPAHAPYDLQALIDIKKTDSIGNITRSNFKDIIPISIIESKLQSQEEQNTITGNKTANSDIARAGVVDPDVSAASAASGAHTNTTNISTSTTIDAHSSKSANTEEHSTNEKNNLNEGFESANKDVKVPAMLFLEKYSITGQSDPNLEKATSELYSLEYYSGKMNDKTYPYSNMTVATAKEKVKEDLMKDNHAVLFYELTNKPVYCRCGTRCYVKLLDNQWFLNYGNAKWKSLAYECLNSMEIIPQEILKEFRNVFDWLKVRACARKSGLGTLLPWDREWLIESLSDSVIYMVYYIIAKYVNLYDLDKYIGYIDNSFFDYVLLDKKPNNFEDKNAPYLNESQIKDHNQAKQNELQEKDISYQKFLEIAQEIKNEFEYYYPLDSRHSGRDLVPNHLSFFIFNHSIIFPKTLWPKQIVVNGSVLMDGKKMSKSMGNIIPLRSTIKRFNADSIRVAMLVLGELLQDVDFSFTTLRGIYSRLNEIYEFANNFIAQNENVLKSKSIETLVGVSDGEPSPLTSLVNNLNLEDKWLLHRLNSTTVEVSKSFDEIRIRDALNTVLYLMDKDFEWYNKRRMSKDQAQIKEENYVFVVYMFLKFRIKMLAPFCPFLGEEVWNLLSGKETNKQSVFSTSWPEFDKNLENLVTEENELMISNLLEDLNKIVKVTKNTNPQKVYIYLASADKKKLYKSMIDIVINANTRNFGVIMKSLLSDDTISEDEKKFIKSNTDLVKKINEDILSLSPTELARRGGKGGGGKITHFDEKISLLDAKSLIANELNIQPQDIEIFEENDQQLVDPKNKSRFSRPYKPAIYIQ
jgi:leucyl-tRNA synthetase